MENKISKLKKILQEDEFRRALFINHIAAGVEHNNLLRYLSDIKIRTIIDIGLDNMGINLDPANLILYGKANPIDAVEIFGKYIRSIHGKDALWPNRDEYLGKEVPVGDGIVNFPLLLRRLKNLGFNGPIIIEREISGEKQIQDIKRAIEFFSKII